jgi:hypothetical protein
MSAADDAAATLAASGLANVVHNALVSAYEQGVASVRGQLDAVQVRYDNAFAEWVAACESTSGRKSSGEGASRLTTPPCCTNVVHVPPPGSASRLAHHRKEHHVR